MKARRKSSSTRQTVSHKRLKRPIHNGEYLLQCQGYQPTHIRGVVMVIVFEVAANPP
jgi:hypothetical protein